MHCEGGRNGLVLAWHYIEGQHDDYLTVNYRAEGQDPACPNMEALWVPFLKMDGKLWMSYAPAEIQSQWVPLQMAHGLVAVGGLGMGYFALAAAARETVQRVVVFERDERVVRMFDRFFADHPSRPKIEVVVGDVYEELPRYPLGSDEWDLVYMDPYLQRNEVRVVQDVITFWTAEETRLRTRRYRYWAQEEASLYLIDNNVRPPPEMCGHADYRFFRLMNSTVQLRRHQAFQKAAMAALLAMAFSRRYANAPQYRSMLAKAAREDR